MIKSEEFCKKVNQHLSGLSYEFKDSPERQILHVNSHNPIYFSSKTGGTVQGGSRQWMINKHKSGKIHEPGMIAAIETVNSLSSPIKNFFDIGALYGYFSLLFLSMSKSANVYSFEMNPRSFSAIQSNVRYNEHLDISRIYPVNCAFSDFSKKGKMSIIKDFSLRISGDFKFKEKMWVFACLLKSFFTRKQQSNIALEIIDFWSVDEWCESEGVLPDIIKIDVEGFQAKILPGAMETIKRAQPFILLEFDSVSAVNSCGLSNKEIVKPLFELGYKLIWGNHRSYDDVFTLVAYDELSSLHERNSLGLFFKESKLTGINSYRSANRSPF